MSEKINKPVLIATIKSKQSIFIFKKKFLFIEIKHFKFRLKRVGGRKSLELQIYFYICPYCFN